MCLAVFRHISTTCGRAVTCTDWPAIQTWWIESSFIRVILRSVKKEWFKRPFDPHGHNWNTVRLEDDFVYHSVSLCFEKANERDKAQSFFCPVFDVNCENLDGRSKPNLNRKMSNHPPPPPPHRERQKCQTCCVSLLHECYLVSFFSNFHIWKPLMWLTFSWKIAKRNVLAKFHNSMRCGRCIIWICPKKKKKKKERKYAQLAILVT